MKVTNHVCKSIDISQFRHSNQDLVDQDTDNENEGDLPLTFDENLNLENMNAQSTEVKSRIGHPDAASKSQSQISFRLNQSKSFGQGSGSNSGHNPINTPNPNFWAQDKWREYAKDVFFVNPQNVNLEREQNVGRDLLRDKLSVHVFYGDQSRQHSIDNKNVTLQPQVPIGQVSIQGDKECEIDFSQSDSEQNFSMSGYSHASTGSLHKQNLETSQALEPGIRDQETELSKGINEVYNHLLREADSNFVYDLPTKMSRTVENSMGLQALDLSMEGSRRYHQIQQSIQRSKQHQFQGLGGLSRLRDQESRKLNQANPNMPNPKTPSPNPNGEDPKQQLQTKKQQIIRTAEQQIFPQMAKDNQNSRQANFMLTEYNKSLQDQLHQNPLLQNCVREQYKKMIEVKPNRSKQNAKKNIDSKQGDSQLQVFNDSTLSRLDDTDLDHRLNSRSFKASLRGSNSTGQIMQSKDSNYYNQNDITSHNDEDTINNYGYKISYFGKDSYQMGNPISLENNSTKSSRFQIKSPGILNNSTSASRQNSNQYNESLIKQRDEYLKKQQCEGKLVDQPLPQDFIASELHGKKHVQFDDQNNPNLGNMNNQQKLDNARKYYNLKIEAMKEQQNLSPNQKLIQQISFSSSGTGTESLENQNQSNFRNAEQQETGNAPNSQQHQDTFLDYRFQVEHFIQSYQLVLQEVIGKGGFKKVHRAKMKNLNQDLAVKSQLIEQSDSKIKSMCISELDLAYRLKHRNLVQFYGFDIVKLSQPQDLAQYGLGKKSKKEPQEFNKLYIVEELCDIGNLRRAMHKGMFFEHNKPQIDLKKVVNCLLQIAEGIQYIHNNNVVHGDLKPENILLKTEQFEKPYPFVVKVTDFGLSIKLSQNQTHLSHLYGGTANYQSPEIQEKGRLGKQADVYAFGVIMWELLHNQVRAQIEQNLKEQDDELVRQRQARQRDLDFQRLYDPYRQKEFDGNQTWCDETLVQRQGNKRSATYTHIPVFPNFPLTTPTCYALLCNLCLMTNPKYRICFQDVLMIMQAMDKKVQNGAITISENNVKQNRKNKLLRFKLESAMELIDLDIEWKSFSVQQEQQNREESPK